MHLLVSEIGVILENGHHNRPVVIWLSTIAKVTCFGIMYTCAKFHVFTKKCTIFL